MKKGAPATPAMRGEEEPRREQEGDFVEKSPSESTADDDEVTGTEKAVF